MVELILGTTNVLKQTIKNWKKTSPETQLTKNKLNELVLE